MRSQNRWSRREFLRTASAATLSALGAGYAPMVYGSKPPPFRASADRMILLWMGGGMAHTETFDPKRYTPYEKGLDPRKVLSTFPSIDTKVDPIQFTAGLENIASVMDRGTLIRSYMAGDLGFILHSRHQYHWHTGYAPPTTVAAPHIGAVLSRTLGPLNPDLPAFIDIGQRFDVGEGEELKAFHSAGFLGREHGPFMVKDPENAAASVRPPEGMSPSRLQNRHKLYESLVEASPVSELASAHQKESWLRSMEKAHRLLSSPASKTFDLSREPKESYERYNTGKFGLGCLLARRLSEVGARFIEVTTEYIPFKNWDTHENGHERAAEMKRQIDRPIAQLVLDLEARGLLDRTLIVLASEFSRDALVEGRPGNQVKDQVSVPDRIESIKDYGMHRHFTGAGSVLLFGGGVKKGHLHGKTADERPCKAVEDPVDIKDLHATLYHAMGIPSDLYYKVEERPFYVTEDGHGKPIPSILQRRDRWG